MPSLYPQIEPYSEATLQVSEIHTIAYEECGDPEGTPVVFLHGGPGGGTHNAYRRYFDPKKWRIVLFDQRGCGKSTPHAELEGNTTWDLVADIEKLRQHLGIEKWHVFGGSWGSTLAMTYAIKHTSSCLGLLLRGIFMLRKKEIDWFYQEGCSRIYPDAWEKYLEPIAPQERHDIVNAYYRQLTSEDKATRLRAAKAWSVWEASTSKLMQDTALMEHFAQDDVASAFARIECHFFINKGFFEDENYILNNLDKIRHLPAVIVQGRYDVVCPAETSWELHRAWPEAEYEIIQDAGHSASEKGIIDRLVTATDKFATIK